MWDINVEMPMRQGPPEAIMKQTPKRLRAWAIYDKSIDALWIKDIIAGPFARGILLEKVSKFFRPDEYSVVQVEIRAIKPKTRNTKGIGKGKKS